MLDLEHEPEVYVDEFLSSFFDETEKIVVFEENFCLQYSLEKPRADYFKLKRFLTTALRNFREIDDKFIAGLLLKLQKDVYSLFDYFAKLQSATQVPDIIYQQKFLSSLKPYIAIQDEIVTTKASRDLYEMKLKQLDEQIKVLSVQSQNEEKLKEIKVLKGKYADAVHYFALARDRTTELGILLTEYEGAFHSIFVERFNTLKKNYFARLTDAINVKAYHLDKLLWDRAERNKRIVDFLSSANIEGNYDTKTFIKYYLRNINVNTSADKEWHNYLKIAMELLD